MSKRTLGPRKGTLSPLKVALWMFLIWCMLIAQTSVAQASYADHQIKAVFLYHFTRFINWPETAFASASSPFNLCTTEASDLSEVLESAIAGEAVAGRPLRLIPGVDLDEIHACQLIFLPAGHNPELLLAIKNLGPTNILTVSDDDDFISQGGIIRLEFSAGRVRPVINTTALDKAHLKASAKLLQLAKLVAQ